MKVFRVLIVTLLALLMAAPAFAVNVKLKADFREFFRYANQMELFNQDLDEYNTRKTNHDSDFKFSQRLRLTWVMEDDEKKVRGTFGAEFDVTAGNRNGGGGTRNGPGGNFEGDRTNFELRLAYIDFELPFDPASRVYMGLQPTDMNALVFCDNAMGVTLKRAFGNLESVLGWYRNDTSANDNWGGDAKLDYANLYRLDLNFDFQNGTKIGGFGYYLYDGQTPRFAQSNGWPVPNVYWDDSTNTYWVGVNGSLEMGNLFGGFTGIYQGGTAHDTTLGDLDISAWLANIEGTAKLGQAYVQLGWIYSTGDDDLTDGDVENYFSIDTDNSTLGSVALLEFWDWNAALYGPYVGFLGMNHAYLNVGYEFNEKTDGRVGFIWFNTAEDFPGTNDTNIGYEINAEVNYAITENLSFGLAGGYLIGEDVWDDLSDDGNADDLWNIISRVRFKF